jgi:predicted nucleic acid-binding protein
MIAYVDASVVLRLVLGEPEALSEWPTVTQAVASTLTEVECLRTLDRLVRRGVLTDAEVVERRVAVFRLLEEFELLDLTRSIMRRAGEPFPTPLGTLDAIHLASALAWRDASGEALVLATHDRELAAAGRAMGLLMVGA